MSEPRLSVWWPDLGCWGTAAAIRRARLSVWWRDLGCWGTAAAIRRAQAGKEEEGRQRDQLAHYQAHVRGRGLAREGEIFSPN